jgi:hypothetical protein
MAAKLNIIIRLFIIIFFLFSVIDKAKCQKLDAIYAIKQGADSVWIVSHEVTGVVIRKENGESEMRLLFKNEKLDSSLLKETHLLNKTGRIQLATLLKKPNTLRQIEMATCFMPQHAIILKKEEKFYCIEVCFSCQKIEVSNGLRDNIPALDNKKWAELRRYFKQKGLRYELV